MEQFTLHSHRSIHKCIFLFIQSPFPMIISDWSFFLSVVYRDFIVAESAREHESLREELVYFLEIQSSSSTNTNEEHTNYSTSIQDPLYETTFQETLQTKSKIQMFMYIFHSNECVHLLNTRLESSLENLEKFLQVFSLYDNCQIIPAVEEFIACVHYKCKCIPFEVLIDCYMRIKRSFSLNFPTFQLKQSNNFSFVGKDPKSSFDEIESEIHEYFDLNPSRSK